MGCEHKRFGCRNNVFFCLDCGAEIPNPYKAEPAENVGKETIKKPATKRTKKGA